MSWTSALGRDYRPGSDKLSPKVLRPIDQGKSYRWNARDLGISKNMASGIVKRSREAA